jgi:hypothetical protein
LFPRESGRFDCLIPETGVEALRSSAYSLNIKVAHGRPCGPAHLGYKAVAVVIVTSQDKQQFEALCTAVEQIEVRLL